MTSISSNNSSSSFEIIAKIYYKFMFWVCFAFKPQINYTTVILEADVDLPFKVLPGRLCGPKHSFTIGMSVQ